MVLIHPRLTQVSLVAVSHEIASYFIRQIYANKISIHAKRRVIFLVVVLKKEKGGREGGEGGEVGKEKKKGERERSLRDTNSQSSEPAPARGSASKQAAKRFQTGPAT